MKLGQAFPVWCNRRTGAQAAQQVARLVMLEEHHSDRILNCSKVGNRNRAITLFGPFHLGDVGEQNILFFLHVDQKFVGQLSEDIPDLGELGMILTMSICYLFGKRA